MMNSAALLTITASVCMAISPPPYYYQFSLLDRVSALAKEGLPARSSALDILERIAEGRMESASPDLEVQVGLEPGKLRGPLFKDSSVRSHALREIGRLDLPEALTYLQNLKEADTEPDISGQVWPAAQIALREAQVNRIPDESAKVRFLEDTISEKSAAAWWAVDELCNRGSYRSLPFIRAHIRRVYSLPGDIEHAIGFCEARIRVISGDPDRTKALGSFLRVANGVTDPELLGWAINELHDMDSPRADAEVERYAHEIDSLPDGSSLKNALLGKRFHIRNLLPHRPK